MAVAEEIREAGVARSTYYAKRKRGETHEEALSTASKKIVRSSRRDELPDDFIRSGTYDSWANMKSRCLNEACHKYPEYGARGIAVCGEWLDFSNFYRDMGDRPAGMTLGRIDNDAGYEPGNCRWETAIQQANNKRNNRRFEYRGESLTLPEWGRRFGIKSGTLRQRFYVLDWTIDRCLETPIRQRRTSWL